MASGFCLITASYKSLCKRVNGYYFIYTEEYQIRFNPFLSKGEVLDREKKESVKTLLIALWKREGGLPHIGVCDHIDSNHAVLYLAKRTSRCIPCFNSFYNFLMQEYLQVK
ncbi:MAG: hypothetical protein M3O71_24540 [Bacteroidota bacterium]|nr:hypothetical protein [Bacteroidota bacterium]